MSVSELVSWWVGPSVGQCVSESPTPPPLLSLLPIIIKHVVIYVLVMRISTCFNVRLYLEMPLMPCQSATLSSLNQSMPDLSGFTLFHGTLVSASELKSMAAHHKVRQNPKPCNTGHIESKGVDSSFSYNKLKKCGESLRTLHFFLPCCIGVRLPLPHPNTMFSFNHLTLRLDFNFVCGVGRGVGGWVGKLNTKNFQYQRT